MHPDEITCFEKREQRLGPVCTHLEIDSECGNVVAHEMELGVKYGPEATVRKADVITFELPARERDKRKRDLGIRRERRHGRGSFGKPAIPAKPEPTLLTEGFEKPRRDPALCTAPTARNGHAIGNDDEPAQNAPSQGALRSMADSMMPTML